jgi:hypothetical protein
LLAIIACLSKLTLIEIGAYLLKCQESTLLLSLLACLKLSICPKILIWRPTIILFIIKDLKFQKHTSYIVFVILQPIGNINILLRFNGPKISACEK